MNSPIRRAVLVLAFGAHALISGCTTGVPQVLNQAIVPQSFIGNESGADPVWPQSDWWQTLGSPELAAFIATAQAGNKDLAVAAARVREAQALTVIQRATLFPQLTGQIQAQRSKFGGNPAVTAPGGLVSNSFALNVGASYEVDLWGLARNTLRAAEETLKSQRYAQQAVALTLTARVADEYFNVLALRRRIGIANEYIAAINAILKTIELRVSAGKSSHLDLAQERAQVESVEAELPTLQEQELEARLALAVLLGQTPQIEVKASGPDQIALPRVSPGLASDLLVRRPDVAQAEAGLASAHANLDAARAAFLPQFALTGGDGFASATIAALLHGPSVAWDYGGSLVQTIFDGGTLIGKKKLAEATQQELIAAYQSTVLNAYADVETALGQVKHNGIAEEHLMHEVEAAQEAFQISELQYRQGTTDLLTVLQSQQTLFSAEDQLAQISLARMQAVVHLYEALGGGWIEPPQERTQTVSIR